MIGLLSCWTPPAAAASIPPSLRGEPGQWPLDQPFYLLIDMQLGGKWVGAIDESQLPVQMEIDWVRVHEWQG